MHVVEPALDLPVAAHQGEQLLGSGALGGERGLAGVIMGAGGISWRIVDLTCVPDIALFLPRLSGLR